MRGRLKCIVPAVGDDMVEILWEEWRCVLLWEYTINHPSGTMTLRNYSIKNEGISLGQLSLSLWVILTSQTSTGNILKWTQAVLKHVEDNFLMEILRELTRKGAHLDLLFGNREGFMGKVVIGDCLSHSKHKVVELQIIGLQTQPQHHRIIKVGKTLGSSSLIINLAPWPFSPLKHNLKYHIHMFFEHF